MNACPNCRQNGRDCWVTRCGDDDLVSREDADAGRGDDVSKAEREEEMVS